LKPGPRRRYLSRRQRNIALSFFRRYQGPNGGRMLDNLFEIKYLTKHFGPVKAVEKVSFSIHSGETLAVVGESGSGKTTLGRLLLRLLEPTDGLVFYEGKNLFGLRPFEMKEVRREAQIIFQDPYTSLDPRMRVGHIVAEPLVVHGMARGKQLAKKVHEMLDLVKLPSSYSERFPHELSGGERQRVGIARALATGPKFIVADEPVSALDVTVASQILELLNELKTRLKLTMLFISHDLMVVQNICDRVLVMKSGKIVEEGGSERIFTAPGDPYTKLLLDSTPKIP
jgi:oligopeptide transport system ATP-binding protein